MTNPSLPLIYLAADDIRAMNTALLGREGASSLLRDPGVLASSIMRPQTAAHYEQADLIVQAAYLIAGLTMAHAFLDGNKRTAAIAGDTFLLLNGHEITDVSDAYGRQIEALVTYQDSLEEATKRLIAWLQEHTAPSRPGA